MKKVYSHSKRSTLDRCSLQYFYEYYTAGYEPPAAKVGLTLFDDLPTLEHRRLDPGDAAAAGECKSLSSCYQVAGQILHNVIAQHWEHPDWTQEWFRRTAVERFDRAVSASAAAGPDGGQRLLERHYRLPDAEATIANARAKLVTAIGNYFDRSEVAELVAEMLASEEKGTEVSIGGLPRIGDFTISGHIDSWARNGDAVRIVDWKMGGSVGDEDSLQLILYGWWAVVKFSVAPECVAVQRVFLGDGSVEAPLQITERLIERCRARLHQDVERMEALHEYGEQGHYEAFPACAKEKLCRQCRFQGMCVALATAK
jgi:PD-(D/E)XK nuclease superfamily